MAKSPYKIEKYQETRYMVNGQSFSSKAQADKYVKQKKRELKELDAVIYLEEHALSYPTAIKAKGMLEAEVKLREIDEDDYKIELEEIIYEELNRHHMTEMDLTDYHNTICETKDFLGDKWDEFIKKFC